MLLLSRSHNHIERVRVQYLSMYNLVNIIIHVPRTLHDGACLEIHR